MYMKNILHKLFSITTLRLLMGFIFLWAFLDKTFGLGFATSPEKSWLSGGSPTTGFLGNAVKGPLADFFHSLAGNVMVDYLFMFGLLFIGLTLLSNKFVKWGGLAGIVMMMLMYFALLLPENNPFVDEHLVYAVLLGVIAFRRD
ncbi:MAG: thiosulfate dehydrogenase (quinone) large subunit [Patescibacteria group bacterium]|nr:thiosulfate dehydrogenase (quinone) large subunit [Patescibacteria group bacterium]